MVHLLGHPGRTASIREWIAQLRQRSVMLYPDLALRRTSSDHLDIPHQDSDLSPDRFMHANTHHKLTAC
jgi:hypothetical protein